MDGDGFFKLLLAVKGLTPSQIQGLSAAIAQAAPSPAPQHEPSGVSIADIEARFAALPCCPHCRSTAVYKWGAANGLRRYRCKIKDCGKTFNALTGTPLAQLLTRELWGAHAQALVDGISLPKVAKQINVDLTTAFHWRHRFLRTPKSLKPRVLKGTVEADETFFLYSEKGQEQHDRAPRKRGGKASQRGLSAEQVPVLIARDHHKATMDQILPNRSAASIGAVLEPILDRSSILSDAAAAYGAFANKINVVHVALNLSAGERTWGTYHIQNVNNYCSRLKKWMRRFNGVATKYLASYLGWHRQIDRWGSTLSARCTLLAAWG